jgi:alkylation response protein AidB-like acyl-CoA dehydrogenase
MYSDEERAFAREVRAFVRAELPLAIRQKVIDAARITADERRAWHRALHARGWAAPHWPVEFGGTGWSAVQTYIFAETLAEEGAPDLGSFGLKMLGPTLIHHGSEEQKGRYLPRILSGEDFWCQGFSEPGAGSDLASLKTRAELVDGHWVVNGQKMWTTMAHEANMMFALVRTDPTALKPQMGISLLLIDLSSPGITIRPIYLLNGERSTNEVFFDNVRVPVENLVGEPHKGWTYSRVVLGNERLTIARIGLNRRQLAKLKRIAAEAGRLDAPLFHAKLAAAEIELAALEAMALAMLERARSGAAPGVEANMLKIKGSELQQNLAELLVEAIGRSALPFGPESEDRERPWANRLFKSHFDTRVATIYGGSNEIQRNIIAKSMGLGSATGVGAPTPQTGDSGDAAEIRGLLRQSLETLLTRLYSFEQRRAAHQTPAGHSADAWAAYAELGLLALGLPEAHGGLPGSLADIAMAAELMGAALVLEPYRPTMVAARLLAAAGTPAQQAAWLPAIAAGNAKAAIAHEEERWTLGGPIRTQARPEGNGWRLKGGKRVVAGGGGADVFILSAAVEAGGIALFLVPAAEASTRPYRCFDWTDAADLDLDVAIPADARLEGGAAELDRALDEAIALACADAVGAIRAVNRLTRSYTSTRNQFGRPIGTFQVLQHRMVDMAIAEELAGPITNAAIDACERLDADGRARAVSAAKVKVGESARYVGQQGVQIHGGMGLTEEYPASHHFARLGLFERAHGDRDDHLQRFAGLTPAAQD